MPSKSQKQADMFQHASHDESYSRQRGLSDGLAEAIHAEDVGAGLFGKVEDGPCPKCDELKEEIDGADKTSA